MLTRRAPIVLVLLLGACAMPPIRLETAYRTGAVRTYRVEASATTRFEVPGLPPVRRSTLRARSRLEVLGTTAEGARVRIEMLFERLVVDGVAGDVPPPQSAEIVVARDGSVLRIVDAGGAEADVPGAEVQSLAPMLSTPLPQGRVELGERWTREVTTEPGQPPAVQAGQVAALRRVGGYDCAVIRLGTRRPIGRVRTIEGRQVALEGTEHSSSEIAFAFRAAFPVAVSSDARARFRVIDEQGGAGGAVHIDSRTTLTLLEA